MVQAELDPRYVLVVDDDPASRETLGYALYRCGFVPLLASSGEEALDFMHGQSAPVLVVLDPRLQGMSLRALLAAFKGDARWARIPVVVVSEHDALDLPPDVSVAFLRKPFDLQALLRLALGGPEEESPPGRALPVPARTARGPLAGGIEG